MEDPDCEGPITHLVLSPAEVEMLVALLDNEREANKRRRVYFKMKFGEAEDFDHARRWETFCEALLARLPERRRIDD